MSILSFFKRKPKSTTLTVSSQLTNEPMHILNPSLDPSRRRILEEIADMANDPKWLAYVEKEKDKEKNKKKSKPGGGSQTNL